MSISHVGGRHVVATADRPIGVDAERLGAGAGPGIGSVALHPAELAALDSRAPTPQVREHEVRTAVDSRVPSPGEWDDEVRAALDGRVPSPRSRDDVVPAALDGHGPPVGTQDDEVLAIWVAKEAALKLTGDGLQIAPESFVVWDPAAPADARWGAAPGVLAAEAITITWLPWAGHLLALAHYDRLDEVAVSELAGRELTTRSKTAGSP